MVTGEEMYSGGPQRVVGGSSEEETGCRLVELD